MTAYIFFILTPAPFGAFSKPLREKDFFRKAEALRVALGQRYEPRKAKDQRGRRSSKGEGGDKSRVVARHAAK